mgnify:FL=1
MVISKQEKREIEEEIHSLFPSFPKEEIPEAVEIMIDYWIYIIENIDE